MNQLLTRIKAFLFGRTLTVFSKTDCGDVYYTVRGVRRIMYHRREVYVGTTTIEDRTAMECIGLFGTLKATFWMRDIILVKEGTFRPCPPPPSSPSATSPQKP